METPKTLKTITSSTLKVGGKYNWRGQALVYIGLFFGGGRWYQFAKVESPTVVWCEVTSEQLASFEETKEVL